MQWVIVFKDYVPLAQTLLWVILIIIAVGIFYQPISGILGSISKRIQEGGAVEAGVGSASLILPECIHDLKKVEAEPADNELTNQEESKSIPAWPKKRQEIIERNREIFLAHLCRPSKIQLGYGKT